jgi:prophage regulatory protein
MDDLQILRLAQVLILTGLKRSTLYSYIDQGMFPQQISLGPRCSGWLLIEVRQWLADRVAAGRPQSATKVATKSVPA